MSVVLVTQTNRQIDMIGLNLDKFVSKQTTLVSFFELKGQIFSRVLLVEVHRLPSTRS